MSLGVLVGKVVVDSHGEGRGLGARRLRGCADCFPWGSYLFLRGLSGKGQQGVQYRFWHGEDPSPAHRGGTRGRWGDKRVIRDKIKLTKKISVNL